MVRVELNGVEIEKVNKLTRNGYNKLFEPPASPLFSMFRTVAIPTFPVSPKSKLFHPLAHHQPGTSHQLPIPP